MKYIRFNWDEVTLKRKPLTMATFVKHKYNCLFNFYFLAFDQCNVNSIKLRITGCVYKNNKRISCDSMIRFHPRPALCLTHRQTWVSDVERLLLFSCDKGQNKYGTNRQVESRHAKASTHFIGVSNTMNPGRKIEKSQTQHRITTTKICVSPFFRLSINLPRVLVKIEKQHSVS